MAEDDRRALPWPGLIVGESTPFTAANFTGGIMVCNADMRFFHPLPRGSRRD